MFGPTSLLSLMKKWISEICRILTLPSKWSSGTRHTAYGRFPSSGTLQKIRFTIERNVEGGFKKGLFWMLESSAGLWCVNIQAERSWEKVSRDFTPFYRHATVWAYNGISIADEVAVLYENPTFSPMNKKERSKYASELGKRSWKGRSKNRPKSIKHLREIASKGGKNRWKKYPWHGC